MFGIVRLDLGFIEGFWSKNVSKENGFFIIMSPRKISETSLELYFMRNTGPEITMIETMDPSNL
jgi:hypothetical protein